MMHRGRRWLRSPKASIVMLLVAYGGLGLWGRDSVRTSLQVLIAVLVCVTVDLAVGYARLGRASIPDSALITGLLVGLILVAGAPLAATVTAAAAAMGSKHLLRLPQFHLFNPAAAGLLASLALVPAGQSWWGALADLPAPFIAALLAGGAFISWRVNKLPATLSFLGVYFSVFTLVALVVPGPSARIAEVFRPPFLNAALFFSCLMMTDPATSPTRQTDELIFGSITALVSAVAFMLTHGLHYLFIGLLVANAWYAWRRTRGGLEGVAQPEAAGANPRAA